MNPTNIPFETGSISRVLQPVKGPNQRKNIENSKAETKLSCVKSKNALKYRSCCSVHVICKYFSKATKNGLHGTIKVIAPKHPVQNARASVSVIRRDTVVAFSGIAFELVAVAEIVVIEEGNKAMN
eukprot:TRINITY_DN3840_c0_g1_i2.p2 TRINITY_DN3840_c0_g1~~TRINITY_DN3840_c0_g1_i2.p2  ORF type:complete len:126 (-),score=8.61 TRINITY_DN3840_c0_g1_i2:648-1025(-)